MVVFLGKTPLTTKFDWVKTMTKKIHKNRDLFLKFCFMHFLVHMLKVLGIDEEIEEVLPTEHIAFENIDRPRIFDNFLDFHMKAKSGKILIFEFKKHALTTKDLKQAYKYYDRIHCKYRADVKLIVIVISKKGKLKEYTTVDFTYHPQIVKTKTINKQKDLSIIRDKLKCDIELSLEESSLLVALPLFDLNEGEAEITEEICKYIKNKKHCIPKEVFGKIVVAMFFNITEYIEPEKQDKLLEMIGVAEEYKGLLAEIRDEGKAKWINEGKLEGRLEGKLEGRLEGKLEGKRDIINAMLKKFSIDTVCDFLDMERSEVEDILGD